MQVPLTHSSYVQRPSMERPRIIVDENGSPRDHLQAKSMEQTLNTRLFTQKKQNLFHIDDSAPHMIHYIEPNKPQVPEIKYYRVRTPVAERSMNQSNLVMTQDDYITQADSQRMRNSLNSAPYFISPVKQREVATSSKPKESGAKKGKEKSIIEKLSCCMHPERSIPTQEIDNERIVQPTARTEINPTETFGQSLLAQLVTPPKRNLDTSMVKGGRSITPSNYSNRIKIIDTFQTPEKVVSSVKYDRLGRASLFFVRKDIAELELYNSKLPEARRLEKRSVSPQQKFSKFNSIVTNLEHINKQHEISRAIYDPEEYSRILRTEEFDSYGPDHDPQPPKLSNLNQMVKRGDIALSPEKLQTMGDLIFTKMGAVSRVSTQPQSQNQSVYPMRESRGLPVSNYEYDEMFQHERVISNKSKIRGYSRTPQRDISVDLDNDSTDVSEIGAVQHTYLKKKLPAI